MRLHPSKENHCSGQHLELRGNESVGDKQQEARAYRNSF